MLATVNYENFRHADRTNWHAVTINFTDGYLDARYDLTLYWVVCLCNLQHNLNYVGYLLFQLKKLNLLATSVN
jgi:hypothetical protein